MRVFLQILALLIFCAPAWAENQFKIITLQHKFGEDLLPVLQPLAGANGAISASGNNLFVDVDAARMPVIEQAVARLDVESRMFGIRVDRSDEQHNASTGADVSGRIGNRVRIERSGTPRSSSGVDVHVDSRTTTTRSRSSEYLNVMDGAPAFIAVGQSVPFTEIWTSYMQRYAQVRQMVQYRDIVTGFSVVPRAIGNEVELQITPRIASHSGDGVIEFETLTTTVRAMPGTWLNLGGTMQQNDEVSRAILSGRQGTSSRSGELWVLVEAQ
jgi:type II secretory pathway component GspD/PulD (secretin)